jgi:hypothetical protein
MEQGSSATTNVRYFWEAKYSGCCVILYVSIDAELGLVLKGGMPQISRL